jgi:hypothetical protein
VANLTNNCDGFIDVVAEDLKEGVALTDKVLNEHFGRKSDLLGGNDTRIFVLTYNGENFWSEEVFFNKLKSDLQALIQKNSLKAIYSNQSK